MCLTTGEVDRNIKVNREMEFNKLFNLMLNPLTGRGHEIAIRYLFECMKCYIPVASLSQLKNDFLIKIKPLKERRLL